MGFPILINELGDLTVDQQKFGGILRRAEVAHLRTTEKNSRSRQAFGSQTLMQRRDRILVLLPQRQWRPILR